MKRTGLAAQLVSPWKNFKAMQRFLANHLSW